MFVDCGGGEEGEGRESNINVKDKHRSAASHMCPNQGLNPQHRYISFWFGVWDKPSNQFYFFLISIYLKSNM